MAEDTRRATIGDEAYQIVEPIFAWKPDQDDYERERGLRQVVVSAGLVNRDGSRLPRRVYLRHWVTLELEKAVGRSALEPELVGDLASWLEAHRSIDEIGRSGQGGEADAL